jgi:hypothetical protein
MTSINATSSAKEDQPRNEKSHRLSGVAILFIILTCLVILILTILTFTEFVKATRPGMLPVSIRADSHADYQPEATRDVFPQINKNILNQIIMEIAATGSPQDRQGTLESVLLSPVPTMTPDPRLVFPATQTSPPAEIATLTPSPTVSFTPSHTPNPLQTSTSTLTTTYTPTVTRTSTSTLTRTPTSLMTRTSTSTLITTKTRTMTRTYTLTPSYTITPTKTYTTTQTFTPAPTDTFTPTDTPMQTATPTKTPTITPTATFTVTPGSPVACNPSEIYFSSSPNIYFNIDELLADITNNFPAAIRITELHLDWQDAGPTRLDFVRLGGSYIWDTIDNLYDDNPPSDFAVSGSEFSWDSSNGARTINTGGSMKTLLIYFFPDTEPLPAGLYTLRVTFGLSANCYIETSITKP